MLFSPERYRNVENPFLNFNLEVPISCSKISNIITTSFGSNSELVCSSLQIPNEIVSEEISVNELKDPSNILSAGKYDNYSISFSGKSVKITETSNSDSSSSPGLLA